MKSVEPGSPAERAGLQVKDRIRRIDDEKGTDQMDERARTWWVEPPGTRVALEVERNKQRQTVALALLPRSQWAGGAAAASNVEPSGASSRVELKPGMTEREVVRLLGEPREKVAFGARSLWRYERFSITFQDGKVTDLK